MRKYAKRWSRLQSLLELLGTPDTKCTHTPVVWNASHFVPHFRLVSTHICFNLLLLLPAALEVLIYEVTCFFGFCLFLFLRQYDSTIISFCVRIEYSASMTQKRGLDWTLCTCSDFVANSYLFSDQTSTIHTRFQTWPLCRNYIIITRVLTKQFFNPFRICIALFLSYSFGIETINTFIHSHSSLENHTQFQTKMGKVYPFSDQNGTKTLPSGVAHTYIAYIREYPTPTPPGTGWKKLEPINWWNDP